jgi:serine protease Do
LVWAIGSPFGLKRSITAGIVSATDLAGVAGHPYQDYIQTDAAVNPGSSGGPLVNVDGRVIGINTAIIGESYRGFSFAVPSNVVRRVCEQIRAQGRVDRGWLGVELRDLVPSVLTSDARPDLTGVYVNDVVADQRYGPSPAAVAGIQRGDIIVSWNGSAVDRKERLIQQVGQTAIGSTVDVEVIRAGLRHTFQVIVGSRRADLLF